MSGARIAQDTKDFSSIVLLNLPNGQSHLHFTDEKTEAWRNQDTEAVTVRTQGSQDQNVGGRMSEAKLSTQVLSFGTSPLVGT